MSTLKLKGSTSGYVELTAPATAGDNTITLPTTAGTVAVKDASNNTEVGTGVTIGSPSSNVFTVSTNGSERVRVDSSGRLAVGTTTPNVLIHASAAEAELKLVSTSGSNSAYLSFIPATQSLPLYIYADSSRNLIFQDYATERIRIDSSGRLLVGTSSSSTNVRAIFQASSGNSAGGAVVRFAAGNTNPGNNGSVGYLGFCDSNHNDAAYIGVEQDGSTWTSGSNMPTRIVLYTTSSGSGTPTERMRIKAAGTTNIFGPADTFWVATSATGTSDAIFVGSNGAGGVNGGSVKIKIYSDGDVENTNNSYGALSDIKLKENIVDANSQWNDIKALKVRNYNLKEGQTHTQIGLIAQEVELVSPGLVSESPDRDQDGNDLGTTTKSVNYSVLYMKAVKALQEAQERIESLESENSLQAASLAALDARLSALESA